MSQASAAPRPSSPLWLAHNGQGELSQLGSTQYTYAPNGNLSQVTGSGSTATYSYANSGQPDELSSYAVTGQPTLTICRCAQTRR
jgi:hypothetical protein